MAGRDRNNSSDRGKRFLRMDSKYPPLKISGKIKSRLINEKLQLRLFKF